MRSREAFGTSTNGTHSAVAFAATTLHSIHDQEMGSVGQELIERLNDMDCDITMSDKNADPASGQTQHDGTGAVYISFDDDDPVRLFINRINILKTSNPHKFTTSLAHEGDHAQSWNNAPILHASPYNTGNPVKPDFVLCARDWVRMVILTEQSAFAKQQWMTSLAEQHDPRFAAAENKSLFTSKSFQQLRAETGSLQDALVHTANEAMDLWNVSPNYRFGHHYVGQALTTYNDCNRLKKPAGLIPVRMELEDMLLAGETLGPNVIADPRLLGRGDLSRFIFADGQRQIESLNRQMGFEHESELPTFREMCAKYNMTPQQFMERSKLPLPSPGTVLAQQNAPALATA